MFYRVARLRDKRDPDVAYPVCLEVSPTPSAFPQASDPGRSRCAWIEQRYGYLWVKGRGAVSPKSGVMEVSREFGMDLLRCMVEFADYLLRDVEKVAPSTNVFDEEVTAMRARHASQLWVAAIDAIITGDTIPNPFINASGAVHNLMPKEAQRPVKVF
jgi:hypothetical protein